MIDNEFPFLDEQLLDEQLIDDEQLPSNEFSDHFANLAEGDFLSEDSLNRLGTYIVQAVQDDMSSRVDWESCLKDAIRLLGTKIERKEWPFKNASGVWDPIMMQSALQFQATAYPELLPPDGPLKSDILGDEEPKSVDVAQRLEEWGNYFLTQIADEYYPDFDQMLFYISLMGCAFKKVYQDSVKNRPVLPFIKPQDLVVNYGTTSLKDCSRIAQILRLNAKEMRSYQQNGFYRNINMQETDVEDVSNAINDLINQSSGLKIGTDEYNKNYIIYEAHVDIDLNDYIQGGEQLEFKEKTFLPYIVTVDVESKKILRLSRNWEEDDPEFKKIQYFIDYQFIRGLGFYGYGYAHILGNQAHTATAILRQLIDAGMLANFPGGLRIKGMQLESDTIRIGPGQFPEVETGGLPLQQAIMTLPYKEPSQTLYTLLEKIEDNANKLAGSANLQTSDLNINAPVGTTLALLEQTQKLQSTIMRRLHQSMREEFRLLYELFKKNLTDEPYYFLGQNSKMFISRLDFVDNVQIIPVSDPNCNSSTHRLIKYEAILRLASSNPQIHDMRQIYEMIYRELKIGNIDKILPPPAETAPLDPLTENSNALLNKPLQAALWQDHQAHIMVHQSLLAQGPNPNLEAHIQQHVAMNYLQMMQQLTGIQLPDQPEMLQPQMQNQIAQQASQVISQMQQQQAEQTPAPIDPAAVMLEDVKVKAMGVDQRAEADMLKARTEAFKAQKRYQIDKEKLALEREKMNRTPVTY